MKWDAAKYVEFGDHRDRPFHDLVARIAASEPELVVDLGCGPGNLTATLAERWPKARVMGLDSSAEMLSRSERHANTYENLHFVEADIADWVPDEATDVVVTNAALQWVPGHLELLSGWLRALRPGAWFALQVPGNFDAPSHALMRQLAGSPEWSDKLADVLRHDDAVGTPLQYLEVMLDAGCDADTWETVYYQVLPGENAVLEWVRSTALRPVLGALSDADATRFEEEYARLLRDAYPQNEWGTPFPFRRIFAVARKDGARQ
ncbi:trans-aconitate 2-methyltransferase [Arthrobacter sp. ISL-30]|uniref:trans-aconitate 2-methyltransferase n=1 Tax=Arthrobacter sp. ISL-30 TaxID=2819109 RepID=UPI001BEA265A|nr:trans-aconitate 2-methyltransferase [Arthrobacter sp. ISL-30]MBT2512931.1 trans-aconitate 2-methyltransferase [Arthrobacter sp. ISL-30]